MRYSVYCMVMTNSMQIQLLDTLQNGRHDMPFVQHIVGDWPQQTVRRGPCLCVPLQGHEAGKQLSAMIVSRSPVQARQQWPAWRPESLCDST